MLLITKKKTKDDFIPEMQPWTLGWESLQQQEPDLSIVSHFQWPSSFIVIKLREPVVYLAPAPLRETQLYMDTS